jgi:hypothetical protein
MFCYTYYVLLYFQTSYSNRAIIDGGSIVGLKTNTLEVSERLPKGSFFILIGHQAGGTRNLYTLPAHVKSFSTLFNVNQEVLDN